MTQQGATEEKTAKHTHRPDRADRIVPAMGEDRPHYHGEAVEEADDIRPLGCQIDTILKSWLQQIDAEEEKYIVTLFQYDNVNRQKQWQVAQWSDECPTAHDIGIEYGPGEYRLLINIPARASTGGFKAVKINIGPQYNILREKLGKSSPASLAAPAVNAGNGLGQSVELLKTIVEIVKPLVESKQQQGAGVAESLAGSFAMMQTIMQNQLQSNLKLYEDIQKRTINPPEPDEPEPEPEPEPDPLARLMPMIEEYLPMLLGKGPAAKATVAVVKSHPEVKKLLKSRGEFARFVAGLDKQIGRDKVDSLLKNFKVERP
jgi:hypothetical protein